LRPGNLGTITDHTERKLNQGTPRGRVGEDTARQGT
jgi:hypothetical protein